jgi:hypothetical protein
MVATTSEILASLRAMLPEHRVMVLQQYDEPDIRELLNEVVRGHSLDEQRALLLHQHSDEEVSVVAVPEPKVEESFEDNWLDIDDESQELEQAGMCTEDTIEMRRPTSLGDAEVAMSVMQVHRSHSHENNSTEAATPSSEPSRDCVADASVIPADGDSDGLDSLFEEPHDALSRLSPQAQDVPWSVQLKVPSAHDRHSQGDLIPDPIHMRLVIPSSDGSGGTYRKIRHLPAPSKRKLIAEFKQQDLTPGHGHRKPLHEASERYERREVVAKRGTCLNMRIYSHNSRRISFELSMGATMRACDCCTRMGRLCARVVLLDGSTEHMLIFYPVNEVARKGLRWTDLDFWM